MNNSNVVPAGASPSVFNNPEFGSVRVIMREDGEPLFCLKDVATCLGYANPTDAVSTKCDPSCVCVLQTQHDSGSKQTKFGPESEVYRLIFGSKLGSAKKFQDWVFKVVLPSIRKTGSYSVAQPSYQIEDPIARAQKWIEEEKDDDLEKIADYVFDHMSSADLRDVKNDILTYGIEHINFDYLYDEYLFDTAE